MVVGDLFVFDTKDDLCLEWLLIRHHPDTSDLILLAPVDDFFMAGSHDVVISDIERLMIVRCAEVDWFHRSIFSKIKNAYCGRLLPEQLSLVRSRITRNFKFSDRPTEEEIAVDCDPNYEFYMEEIATTRSRLLHEIETCVSENLQQERLNYGN